MSDALFIKYPAGKCVYFMGSEHWVMTEGVGDVVCLSLNPSHREAVVQKLFSDAHEALIV